MTISMTSGVECEIPISVGVGVVSAVVAAGCSPCILASWVSAATHVAHERVLRTIVDFNHAINQDDTANSHR